MSIVRINRFKAGEGHAGALKRLLESFLPVIEQSEGCLRCRLIQKVDDTNDFVIIEEWTDIDAHKAATGSIPPEAVQKAMTLLAGPPSGAYYE